MKPRKRNHEKAVRINVSLPPRMLTESEGIISRFGFDGLSDYLQTCIRRDAGLMTPPLNEAPQKHLHLQARV